MAEIDKLMDDVQAQTSALSRQIGRLLISYESLFKETNQQFIEERTANNGTKGLEDFYRLVSTIRRNRDVVGSLLRGLRSIKPLTGFRIIEETIPEPKPKESEFKKAEFFEQVNEPVVKE